MRVALLSLNAYLASHLLNRPADLSWDDARLGAYLAEIKHDKANIKIYDDAKHSLYLWQNGGGAYLMAELYGVTHARAQYLLGFIEQLFPIVTAFKKQTLQEAHDNSRLTNPWGYRLPCWDIFRWDSARYQRLRVLWRSQRAMTKNEQAMLGKIRQGIVEGRSELEAIKRLCWSMGDEAKAALSFYQRDSGAAMLKDSLLAMEDEFQLASRGIIRACIHDAIVAICKKVEADQVAEQIRSIMERPVARLDGLVVPVEISLGSSWDKRTMKEWERSLVNAG
jgi:DNA polymerase I-like protein with 3'-5' exonuclease and polymerase domains